MYNSQPLNNQTDAAIRQRYDAVAINQTLNQPNAAMMSQEIPDHLRYLWVAEFDDGSQLAQTVEDKSQFKEGVDASYDWQYLSGLMDEKPEQIKRITRFHLTNHHAWYTVDLTDGKFEVNGFPFDAHPQLLYLGTCSPLSLIFFKERRNNLYQDGHTEQWTNRFFIGWWCYDASGKKVQQTIAVT